MEDPKDKQKSFVAMSATALIILIGSLIYLFASSTKKDTNLQELAQLPNQSHSVEKKTIVIQKPDEPLPMIEFVELEETVVEVTGPNDSRMNGITVSFPRDFVGTSTQSGQESLPELSLTPALKYKWYWLSPNQFKIEFLTPLLPKQSLKIQVKEFPLEDGRKVVFNDEKKASQQFTTPDIQVVNLSVTKFLLRRQLDLVLNWNYPVNEIYFAKMLVGNLETDAGTKIVFKPGSFTIKSQEGGLQHLISIKDGRLVSGTFKLGLTGPIKISGSQIDSLLENEFSLEPTKSFDITNVTTTSSQLNFTLNATCNVPVEKKKKSYYNRRPKCEPDATSAVEFIKIEPKVNLAAIPGRGNFILAGDFQPKTTYHVTFYPGLTVNGVYVLGKKKTFTVNTGNFKSSFTFKGKARYLPPHKGLELQYQARNVEKLQASVHQIYADNIVHWLNSNEYYNNQISDQVKSFELKLKSKENELHTGTMDLSAYNPLGSGIFAVRVTGNSRGHYIDEKASVVVTDIGVIAKREKTKIIIYTFSLKNLAPKTAVNVQLRAYSNKLLGQCITTGIEASCTIDNVEDKFNPYALILSNAQDLTYLSFNDLKIPTDHIHAGNRQYSNEQAPLESYIYSSRGVYRPGEIVNFSSITRTSSGDLADNMPIQWKIKNPKDKIILEKSVKSDEFGMSLLNLSTTFSFPTGSYRALLYSGKKQIGQYNFLIEEFVPERIGIKINTKEKHLINASTADFEIDAKYLFGPPVAKGKFSVNCTINQAFTSIPKRKDYKTGPYSKDRPKSISLMSKDGVLDKEGMAKTKCDFGDKLGANYAGVMRLNMRADVSEAGSGRTTSQNSSVLLAESEQIIGLKVVQSKDQSIQIEAGLFDLEGNLIESNQSLDFSLFELRREWFYTTNNYGYYEWKTEEFLIPAKKDMKVKLKNGKAMVNFSTQKSWGQFLVRAKLNNQTSVSDVLANMGGYYWWGHNPGETTTPKAPSPQELKVNLSKQEVVKGESFDIHFVSPFKGRALITIESHTVHQQIWKDINKGAQKFSLNAPEILPNFYVSVLVLKDPVPANRPNDYVPARAWGGASVTVLPEDYILDVAIEAEQKIRGGNQLKVNISNKQNKEAQYTIAVIDEGILQLTRFATPRPRDYFFEPRALAVKSFDSYGWTFSKSSPSSPGGGYFGEDGSKKDKVMPVKLVSIWTGKIKSDGNGKASTQIDIPPFQGKVRIMVVGVSENGRFGSSEAHTIVRDPLVLQPTLPRFLAMNDNFSIPVNVMNMTGKKQEVEVTVKTNKHISLKVAAQKAEIENNQSKTFYFPVSVKSFTGLARFDIVANDGTNQSKDYFNLPIQPVTPEINQTLAKKLNGEFKIKEFIPEDMRPDTLQVDFSLSTIPNLDRLAHLKQLIRYPYGCLEQTTSSTYPLLFATDILKWIDPEISKKYDIKEMVESGVNRILSMQTSDGGFGYWPGATQANLWATAYATNMLIDADKQGFVVPNSTLQGALDYLQEAINSGRHRESISYYIKDSEPFVLAVLAKSGRPVKEALKNLHNKKTTWGALDVENQFLMAFTAKASGLQTLYNKIANQNIFRDEAPEGRYSSNTFWSQLRTDGMRLSFMEDIWPGHEATELLANRLAQKLAGRSNLYSTQDLAWAMAGLGKRVAAYKGVEIKNATLALDGKTLAPHATVLNSPSWHFRDMDFLKSTFKLNYESAKTPYSYIKLTGNAKTFDIGQIKSPGFSVQRNYLDLEGAKLDLKKIKQGQLVVIELEIVNKLRTTLENLAVVDRLPSGFEIENPRLGRSTDRAWIKSDAFEKDYMDLRDDRIQVFGNLKGKYQGNTTKYFRYMARAVTAGSFTAPPARMELMYEPEKVIYSSKDEIHIKR